VWLGSTWMATLSLVAGRSAGKRRPHVAPQPGRGPPIAECHAPATRAKYPEEKERLSRVLAGRLSTALCKVCSHPSGAARISSSGRQTQ
jgi:hypothetical protein